MRRSNIQIANILAALFLMQGSSPAHFTSCPYMLVSTHLVCERLSAIHYHIPVTRIFGSKFLECPHSSILGMLVWSTPVLPNAPNPPPIMKIWPGLDTLDLSWFGVPPPLPPPLKMKIWPDLGTLYLSWSGVPHPPHDLCGSWCVETNRCIPQGYRLVIMVCNHFSLRLNSFSTPIDSRR